MGINERMCCRMFDILGELVVHPLTLSLVQFAIRWLVVDVQRVFELVHFCCSIKFLEVVSDIRSFLENGEVGEVRLGNSLPFCEFLAFGRDISIR